VADDIWDLDWTIKLAVQILAAVLLAWGGVQLLTLPFGGILIPGAVLSLALTVFAVVLVMNAINFIDGLDGLVAGVAIIANGVFFIYVYLLQFGNRFEYFNLASLITVVVAGACFGFLLLNWHPAKLFMGDSGALLVGLLMATSSISVTGGIDPGQIEDQEITRSALLGALIPVILPLAILVVPLLDFGLAVIRRLRAGKSPFSADRLHLHHRLLDMGHSHFHAVLIFYGWTTVLAVGCLLPLLVHWGWALVFIGVGLAVCVVVTLLPLTRRKAGEAAAQSAPPEVADAAKFDPLDAASTGAIPLPTELDALERIRKKKEA
jgi:UDP-GlcNAc:undecaprenyl-phosphate GlcNAc-1-phosphate transferase